MAIRLRIFQNANIQSAPSIQEIIIFSTCNKSFLPRHHFSSCVHININLHKHPHSNSYIVLKIEHTHLVRGKETRCQSYPERNSDASACAAS